MSVIIVSASMSATDLQDDCDPSQLFASVCGRAPRYQQTDGVAKLAKSRNSFTCQVCVAFPAVFSPAETNRDRRSC